MFLRLFLSTVSIFRLYCASLPNLCWYSGVSHDGSSYTKEIGKGYKSTPSSLFLGELVVTHLPAPHHWIWSLRKSGVVSAVEKSKHDIWRAEKILYIHPISSNVGGVQQGLEVWQLAPIFLYPYTLQIPSKSYLDGCSLKQKCQEATLGKVPQLLWTFNQMFLLPRDEISQWCHLVSKNSLAPKRRAQIDCSWFRPWK